MMEKDDDYIKRRTTVSKDGREGKVRMVAQNECLTTTSRDMSIDGNVDRGRRV